MRHFRMLPEHIEFSNLLPVQKEFIMLLVAYTPSVDILNTMIHYQEEKETILNTDYTKFIKTPKHINIMLAKRKNMTLEKYEAQINENTQKEKLRALDVKYGIVGETDIFEQQQKVVDKYKEIAQNLENNPLVDKMKSLDRFFKKPDDLENSGNEKK